MADHISQRRILVVEDDPVLAFVIAEMLEEANFEVDGPYLSLSDGVAAVAEHMPDGAVLDVQLEDHDASILAGDLELYDIPFVICSGLLPRGSFGARFGGHPFVSKDRARRDLVPTLETVLH